MKHMKVPETSNHDELIGITKLLSETASFYKSHWQTFVPILAVGILPSLLANLLFTKSDTSFAVLSIIGLVTNIWASTTMFYALKQITDRKSLDVKTLFTNSVPHIIPFIVTGIIVIFPFLLLGIYNPPLTSLLVTLPILALAIGGFVLLIWGCSTVYVYFYEGKKYFNAFKRSKELASGYFWDILQRVIVLLLFTIAVAVLFSPLVKGSNIAVQQLINAIQTILIAPFGVYYMYLLYDSLRNVHSVPSKKA